MEKSLAEVALCGSEFEGGPAPLEIECGAGVTRQSEKDSCDINLIVARYDKTGLLPESGQEGLFLDVSEVGDYRTAVERIRNAERFFMQMPAQVRSNFDNDPAKFLDFLSDPANAAQAEKMGLVPAPEAPAPAAAPPGAAGAGGGTPA